MTVPLIINGVTFNYPQQFDLNWGPTLTNWSTAVTNGMLQKAGGSFALTSEVDFGSSFGIKVKGIKSEESNIAQSGYLRLANASAGLVWRNAANNADLSLTVNASNQLTFNGINVGASTSLTNAHIFVGNVSNQPADVAMSGDISITNAGVTTIGAGTITNAKIIAAAGISVNKLAVLTVSQIVTSDGSGFLTTTASPTLTELSYLAGVSSAIQTQLNARLPLAGGTMSGVLNMGSNKIVSLAEGGSSGEAVTFDQIKGFRILQIQVGTSTTAQATSSTSFINSNVSVSITPSNVANQVLLIATGVGQVFPVGVAASAYFTLAKNTTNLLATNGGAELKTSVAGTGLTAPITLTYLDAPASISALTYRVQLKISDASGSADFGSGSTTQNLYAIEIG